MNWLGAIFLMATGIMVCSAQPQNPGSTPQPSPVVTNATFKSAVPIPVECITSVQAAFAMHSKSDFAKKFPVIREIKSLKNGWCEIRFGLEWGPGLRGLAY